MAVSFIGGGNQHTRRNHRPAESHWQTLWHNGVSSTPRHEVKKCQKWCYLFLILFSETAEPTITKFDRNVDWMVLFFSFLSSDRQYTKKNKEKKCSLFSILTHFIMSVTISQKGLKIPKEVSRTDKTMTNRPLLSISMCRSRYEVDLSASFLSSSMG